MVNLSILIKNKETIKPKLRLLLYLPSILFFLNNLHYEPIILLYRLNNSWSVRYPLSFSQILFDVYYSTFFILGIWIFYKFGKNSNLKREKKQAKIIISTSIISCTIGCITDTILPIVNIKVLPLGIVVGPIGLIGIWYSISKYKMIKISSTPKYLSAKYI